jgi:hypothetical protein
MIQKLGKILMDAKQAIESKYGFVDKETYSIVLKELSNKGIRNYRSSEDILNLYNKNLIPKIESIKKYSTECSINAGWGDNLDDSLLKSAIKNPSASGIDKGYVYGVVDSYVSLMSSKKSNERLKNEENNLKEFIDSNLDGIINQLDDKTRNNFYSIAKINLPMAQKAMEGYIFKLVLSKNEESKNVRKIINQLDKKTRKNLYSIAKIYPNMAKKAMEGYLLSSFLLKMGGKVKDTRNFDSRLSNENKQFLINIVNKNISNKFSIKDEKLAIKLLDTAVISLVNDTLNPTKKELSIMKNIYKKTDEIKNILINKGKEIVGQETLEKYLRFNPTIINKALQMTADASATGSPVDFEGIVNKLNNDYKPLVFKCI